MKKQQIVMRALLQAQRNGFAGINLDLIPSVIPINNVIFNHDFAKAFWGEKRTCFICGSTTYEVYETNNSNGHDTDINCSGCGAEWMDKNEFSEQGNTLSAWQYHLQQMVLEEEPVNYLKKFI